MKLLIKQRHVCGAPRVRAIALFLIMLTTWLSLPSFALAQSDTGTITVHGSVAPAPTSITTSITASPADPISQNQEITYTITYSSSNVSAVPLQFAANWDKGTVAGATDANVDVVEYAIGSATAAYGGASPIVDTINKKISWNIPALPSGAGEQQVQFVLRTTANYTGTRAVSFPTTAFVVSPVGVPDKVVTKNYQFVPGLETTEPSPNPSPGASPTSDMTTPVPASSTPTPTSTSTASAQAEQSPSSPAEISTNSFESISFPAIGAVSARIRVRTTAPTDLVLVYGSDPTELYNRISLPAAGSSQDFVLVNLQPQTKYFFKIQAKDGSINSDLFTFETASKVVEQEATAMNVTMTQERNMVYFGPPSAATSEQIQPIIVTKSSLLDLTLKFPNSASISKIEAFIRNTAVLGASTEEFNLDDLQSSTTRLAKVGEDLYVGKLRVPESSGSYEVVSRIEDIYGNIIEREVHTLTVVQPFRVVEEGTNDPLAHAKVTLSSYNTETKIYEVVSNVTSNIRNPSYSEADGTVQFTLFPARYKAEVSLTGYKDQTVEFEISNSTAEYPQVKMVKSLWLPSNSIQNSIGFVRQISEEIVKGLLSLNHIQDYYNITLAMTLILLVLIGASTYAVVNHPHTSLDTWMSKCDLSESSRMLSDAIYLLPQACYFLGSVLIFHTFVFGIIFLQSKAPQQGLLLIAIGLAEIILLSYVGLLIKHRQLNKN